MNSWLYGLSLKKNRSLGLPLSNNLEQGLQLNGTSQYGTSNISTLSWFRNCTMIFWFRWSDFGSSNILHSLFSSYNDTSNYYIIRSSPTTNSTATISVIGGIANPTGVSSSITVNRDNMIHMLCVVEETVGSEFTCKIYYDGVLFNSHLSGRNSNLTSSFYTNNETGREFGIGTRLFKGVLGEVRFIPQVLTALQVKSHWNRGQGNTNLDNLSHFLWYKFEGNGNDSSGNSRTLTLTGSPTFTSFI
jgi:hypothetical protein